LLDAKKYLASDIAELYYKRWDVELNFADIKTTLGMDILRYKTPEMVRKEILMHFIVYNCIRNLMVDAVIGKEVNLIGSALKAAYKQCDNWSQA
jgi:IS4 transposase